MRLVRKEILRTIHEFNQAGNSYTSQAIAAQAGCHFKTVGIHVRGLIASGYIVKEAGRGRTPNRYQLLQPAYVVLGLVNA